MIDKLKTVIRSSLFDTDTDKLIGRISPFTLASPGKLQTLVRLSRHVLEARIVGDVVECGVYKGGSAAVLGSHMPPGSRIWLYDSFCGMPETTEQDGSEAKEWVGKCEASPDDVREAMRRAGVG